MIKDFISQNYSTCVGNILVVRKTLKLSTCFRERNIVEQVKSLSPKFQDGVKAFSDSPIIGEVIPVPHQVD